jgi:hypothetical protein
VRIFKFSMLATIDSRCGDCNGEPIDVNCGQGIDDDFQIGAKD